MAILKRIANGTGDGAGRARYATEKAVAIRTDMPSYLSLLLAETLTEELKKEIANEFNRQILLHQGDYRTQHFIVSFGHHLTEKEIEKVLDRLEKIFQDPLRLHLFVVHQEDHGTAVHIVESADPEGKLRHLSRKEFFKMKKTVVKELQPFLNKKEKEIARNFERSISTQDWKHAVELKAPQRSWKEYIRQTVQEVTNLLEAGEVEKAVELLENKKVKIQEVKSGEVAPTGKRVSRDNVYAVYRDGEKTYAIRLSKKMKATFEKYKTVFEELKNESERAIREISEVERGISELEKEISSPICKNRRADERDRGTGEKERRIDRRADLFGKLEKLAELEQELEEYRKELEELENITERYAREPEQDNVDRNRRNRSSDISTIAVIQGQVIYGQVIYAGIVDGRVVISDRREVLQRIGAESIEKIDSPKSIAEYWKKHRCKGYVELYMSSIPKWTLKILEGLKDATWTETYKPAWSTIERTKEHRPTKACKRKYWELDGDIVLDEDVLERPEMYLRADNQEIREVAREAIKWRREVWRIEEEIERERERDDDFGMGL